MPENLHLNEALGLAGRLLLAALLGGVLGYERQRSRKFAGLRTHMLVAVACATFVVATLSMGGSRDDVARVVQGAAAGIGFIGAGPILKASESEPIRGLTTAASIWTTAAIGVAAGMGSVSTAVVATAVAWLILGVLVRFEHHDHTKQHDD